MHRHSAVVLIFGSSLIFIKQLELPIYTPHPWNLFVRGLTSLETGSLYSVRHLNPVTAYHRCSQTSAHSLWKNARPLSLSRSLSDFSVFQLDPLDLKKQEVASEGCGNWARPTPRVQIPQHLSTEWGKSRHSTISRLTVLRNLLTFYKEALL